MELTWEEQEELKEKVRLDCINLLARRVSFKGKVDLQVLLDNQQTMMIALGVLLDDLRKEEI
jgi:hypothetical protein